MRRKPSQQNAGGYNNQRSNNKPRFQQGGGDYRSQGQNNNNRPRKNYTALREKYLSQARDALASGDRVLAENYFQHAEHCYRMMVEEGYNFRNNQPHAQNNNQQNAEGGNDGTQQDGSQHEGSHQENGAEGNNDHQHHEGDAQHESDNVAQLPAFLTGGFEPEEPKPAAQAANQGWEE